MTQIQVYLANDKPVLHKTRKLHEKIKQCQKHGSELELLVGRL